MTAALIALWVSLLFSPQVINTGRHRQVATGGGGYTGPTVVQACSGSPCTFGSAITSGSQLFFCGVYLGTITGWTGDSDTFINDPGSSAAIFNLEFDTVNHVLVSCAHVNSATGGGTAISLTGSPSFQNIKGYEISTSAFNKSDNGSAVNSNGAPPFTSLTVTPTANNSLLVGYCVYDAATTLSVGTNVAWVLGLTSSNNLIESFGQTTATSTTAQCGSTASGNQWFAHIAVFH